MTDNERDTHFQEYAELLYPELTRDFYLLYTFRHEDNHVAAEQIIYQIKQRLAQRGYDLAVHVLSNEPGGSPWSYEHIIYACIPDLTAWPE